MIERKSASSSIARISEAPVSTGRRPWKTPDSVLASTAGSVKRKTVPPPGRS
jgi:hypothetical protein